MKSKLKNLLNRIKPEIRIDIENLFLILFLIFAAITLVKILLLLLKILI